MMKKIRQVAEHYWMDHKIEVVIFAVLVVSLIIKQDFMYYGDGLDILGLHLEDLNGKVRVINNTDPTYIEILVTISTAAPSSGNTLVTPSGSPEILDGAIVDMSQVYTSLDDITFDVIYTEGGLEKHETVTITNQSSNSDNIVVIPDLGVADPIVTGKHQK